MLKMVMLGADDDTGEAGRVVVLGLSHENLARLKAGKPIDIDGDELGLGATRIVIFAGETEQSMMAQVQELIGPGTKVRVS
jgi:hypothetical protein